MDRGRNGRECHTFIDSTTDNMPATALTKPLGGRISVRYVVGSAEGGGGGKFYFRLVFDKVGVLMISFSG